MINLIIRLILILTFFMASRCLQAQIHLSQSLNSHQVYCGVIDLMNNQQLLWLGRLTPGGESWASLDGQGSQQRNLLRAMVDGQSATIEVIGFNPVLRLDLNSYNANPINLTYDDASIVRKRLVLAMIGKDVNFPLNRIEFSVRGEWGYYNKVPVECFFVLEEGDRQ